ncbi:Subunit of the glycosylphosphatidylinositol transamidase complex-like protein [Coemansia sp. RSA 989]|nr:GPI transamidase component PIG-T [Coemansia mojavensis]KAJ1740130.1 Subunit of the glycosylphosphatidylinositol transamidase complex-like protein [Coemansia sp. RSA 1086]KAJ1862771.1 Subunit of the glycosylphosphatidylinositol transamidase complex-like protein [Coemansia sp. RSA 989]KAJ1872742.1 Subunit of the glycosylphosphatidylinositol transamidase complex-like protein [Coemansia sp. RSA 990]KAJ2632090.1 Subunit of the glycosylphosphatidylinositol transamidase complex-like protein [Coeman
MKLFVLAVLAACCCLQGHATETYTEDLLLVPLPADGKVLLQFEFEMRRPQDNGTFAYNYHLFPRQLGEIARRYGVAHLDLAFTQGTWRETRWGPAPTTAQGIGAEVVAQLADTADADAQWAGLTSALSGVFCASLNFVDSQSTTRPRLAASAGGTLWHAHLPRENVCTENLTPWIKQLPCQAQSGLGALLNPHRLFDMHFHSMAVSLESNASDLSYRQRLSVVLDAQGTRLSLRDLVGRVLAGPCAAASRSTLRIAASTDIQINPPADHTYLSSDTRHVQVYDLQQHPHMEDIDVVYNAEMVQALPMASIAAHRYVTGHGGGGSSGGIETILTNRRNTPVTVAYFDTLPWYLRMYLHTLKVHTTDSDGHTGLLKPTHMLFTPAVDRGRPAVLELALELPPLSRSVLRYDFDKGFLKYSEHPPDANRGFNIAPAVITYQLAANGTGADRPLFCTAGSACTVRVHTEPALASLPTPDFSMPYNVITFTSTILALFFGRIFNLLTRDFAVLAPGNRKAAS